MLPNLDLNDGSPLLKGLLGLSLLDGVAELHFGVEGFYLVGAVIHVLVGSLNRLCSGFDLQLVFQRVYLPSLYLFLLEPFNSVIIFFLPHRVDGVRPVGDSGLRLLLKLYSVFGPHLLLVLARTLALLFDSLQVVQSDNCVVLVISYRFLSGSE